MSKFLIVFKQEYTQIVKKKSFLIGLILTPVILLAFMVGPALLAKKKSTETEHLAIVDKSGLEIGKQFSLSLKEYTIEETETPYYAIDDLIEISGDENDNFTEKETELNNLITDNQLKYYIVIESDVLNSDTSVYVVASSENIISYQRFRHELSSIISSIRLEQSSINLPIDSVLAMTSRIDLIAKDIKGESVSFTQKYFVALIFVMLMYILIFGNGQMVMRSVIDEKNSRIMEVLISSVSPFQMMMGKIFGIGAATLTQVLIWIFMGLIAILTGLANTGDAAGYLEKIIFNPYLIIYFVIFLVTGFLLYSTLFALLGSIVTNEKEAQNFMFPIVMFLMAPIMIGMYIIQEPNSVVSIVLSYIPVFTPTMLVMRLSFLLPSVIDYSMFSGILLQANIAVVIMIVTVIGTVWLTAKVFRVGVLMYGKRATLPEIIKWVKH